MSNADPENLIQPERLAALRELSLLDTAPEEAFDRLTRLAAAITKSPTAFLSLVDAERVFFKSRWGMNERWAGLRDVPLDYTFCRHVVMTGQMLAVEDARFHTLVSGDSHAIQEMGIIGYLGIPLTLKSGHTVGAFCLIDDKPRHWSDQDVTVAREMAASALTEIALRIESARHVEPGPLNGILDVTSDLVLMMGMDNRVRAHNPAAAAFFGIADGEPPRIDSLLRGEVYEFLRNEALPAARRGGWSGDFYFIRHDGHPVPVSAVVLVHRDHSGEPAYWSITARDITALRETEQILQKSLEQAQHVTGLQGRFIHTLAHEFRNPLSNILSSLELLIRHRSPDPSAHYERMKKGVREITGILDHGLNLLQGTGDEHTPSVEIIELDAFARVAAVEAAPENARIIDIEAPTGTHVAVDVAALRPIAEELLSNAIKYSTTGTVISLKLGLRDCTEAGDCQLVMYVIDRGVGIPDEDQPFVFEPFYRAYNQPNVPGLGAGLPRVKRLVELLNGKIEFFSREGEGTQVVIMLPVTLKQSPPDSDRSRQSRQQSPSA